MSKLTRALAITLLAASIPTTIVMAQQSNDTTAPATEQSAKERGPSQETMDRLEDGRIAMAKTALKLSPEQEKLWGPVEEKMRAGYAERSKMREEWRAKREARRGEHGKHEKLALPDRIEQRSQRMVERATKMTERAGKLKEFAEVVKPLYASLSDEQKEVAKHVLGRFGSEGHRGHGRRWAMGGMGDGMGHGMGHHMGHGMGPGMDHGPKGDGPDSGTPDGGTPE